MPELRLISPEGMEKLREEWNTLYRDTRPKLLLEISAAAAQGDRSENAEYIYGKKKLREIDKRLRILDEKIQSSKVVSAPSQPQGKVAFGARIKLLKPDGKDWSLQIVGVDEIDPLEGRISMDSPMGQSLLGRSVGEEVPVSTPRGIQAYRILAVDYP